MRGNTIVGIAVSPTSRLDFEIVFDSAFDDRRDLCSSLGVCYCRGFDRYCHVVRLDILDLIERTSRERVEVIFTAKCCLDGFDKCTL